jgi:hypothetical protein
MEKGQAPAIYGTLRAVGGRGARAGPRSAHRTCIALAILAAHRRVRLESKFFFFRSVKELVPNTSLTR